MSDIYELPCFDNRKSFYGKAHVIRDGHVYDLLSYDTVVLRWDEDRRELTRLWSEYSATTMRHVNSFLTRLGISAPGGKTWWDNLTPYVPLAY